MNFSKDEKIKKAHKIFDILKDLYPDAKPLLNYKNPYELLVATILAAQCTDERVNQVTPRFFKEFHDPKSLLCAQISELEEIIRPTGFYRNKAKNLKKMSFALVDKYDGILPESIEELIDLPGVGRKTANVITGHCFGKPSIIVDTHFKRVIGRLGLSEENNPDKIEKEIKELISESIQTKFSDVINFHGRYKCNARKPKCNSCEISGLCPYPDKEE